MGKKKFSKEVRLALDFCNFIIGLLDDRALSRTDIQSLARRYLVEWLAGRGI